MSDQDHDLVVHAYAVAGDVNYDHAPVIHDLCAEIIHLRWSRAELVEALADAEKRLRGKGMIGTVENDPVCAALARAKTAPVNEGGGL